jgi:catechol 2,3-dioxygenase-like lactoylglutathione lyase family enzyme
MLRGVIMKNGFMVIIGVNNLDESLAFYEKHLGCKLVRRIAPAKNIEIAFVLYRDTVEFELLRRKDLPPINNDGTAAVLAFATDDIDAAWRSFQEHQVKCEGAPGKLPSGVKVLRFQDPNGTRLSLMQE